MVPRSRTGAALGGALSIGLLVAIGWAAAPAAGRGDAPSQATPIIDPLPELEPVFLPAAMHRFDPRLPDPLGSSVRGHLHALQPLGRARCAPATHVLLDKPQGVVGAEAVAVLYAAPAGPRLDLFVGTFVEVTGGMGFSPPDCAILTEWLMLVDSLTVIDLPPGGAGISSELGSG